MTDVAIQESKSINFKYASGSATLKFRVDQKEALLSDVRADIPGVGHGSAVMEAVVLYADNYGIDILLKAQKNGDPHTGLTNEQLVAFYSKFGFVAQKDTKPVMMVRKSIA